MWFRPRRDDLLIGRTGRFAFFPPVSIAAPERTGHMYVVGKTGKGKSKLLVNCLYQDIVAGGACGVIDPQSDLVTDVLELLYRGGELERHHERIIYLNPADTVIP